MLEENRILVVNPLKDDNTTTNKEKMTFARVLIEVLINQEYPKVVRFENEVGCIVEKKVQYE